MLTLKLHTVLWQTRLLCAFIGNIVQLQIVVFMLWVTLIELLQAIFGHQKIKISLITKSWVRNLWLVAKTAGSTDYRYSCYWQADFRASTKELWCFFMGLLDQDQSNRVLWSSSLWTGELTVRRGLKGLPNEAINFYSQLRAMKAFGLMKKLLNGSVVKLEEQRLNP